jgi:uncharacterized protein (TIGR03000 family)
MLHNLIIKIAGAATVAAALTLTPAAWAQHGHGHAHSSGGHAYHAPAYHAYGGHGWGGYGWGGRGWGGYAYSPYRHYGYGYRGYGWGGFYPWLGGYAYSSPYWSYPYYGYSSGYFPYTDYAYSYPIYNDNAYNYPDTEYASIPPPATAAAPASTAYVSVEVPGNAEVWFDNVRMTETGTVREFVTPPLVAGRDFAYDVRARWMDPAGNLVDRMRHVTIHAGDRVNVNFVNPTY